MKAPEQGSHPVAEDNATISKWSGLLAKLGF